MSLTAQILWYPLTIRIIESPVGIKHQSINQSINIATVSWNDLRDFNYFGSHSYLILDKIVNTMFCLMVALDDIVDIHINNSPR